MTFVKENNAIKIAEELRRLESKGIVVITKDDCISIKAEIAPRLQRKFCLHYGGIFMYGKTICLGNYHKNLITDEETGYCIGAEKIEYTHLSVDDNSISLTTPTYKGVDLTEENWLAFTVDSTR